MFRIRYLHGVSVTWFAWRTFLLSTVIVLITTDLYVCDESPPQTNSNNTSSSTEISPLQLYREIFKHKRAAHQEAVRSLLGMDYYAKQYKMVKTMLENMSAVLAKSQVHLQQSGFIPGSPFPEDDSTKEGLMFNEYNSLVELDINTTFSSVVENTAFFGDILMRLPDITHDILKRKKEWEATLLWGVGFCQESEIFVGNDAKLLHLMLQELDLIQKDEDYVNPYSKSNKLKPEVEAAVDDVIKASIKTQKKRKQREKKRGPRMSRSEL